eukprot:CAMPEP_0201916562 /NCGR_PEP_ID=MMETSP0903-20130614/6171_1 /ASSEMBLY_ACC=CAM_ASM_000552 /TAXON_ID=420261 /ORGANISM="Thalassiosira antarctica, Strain CCMP982" /LENGTH=57 /DNA_ID=CAMNT_0048452411 /DNA_START=58 /DNA_END=231 /DNA_ORIENTATION=+
MANIINIMANNFPNNIYKRSIIINIGSANYDNVTFEWNILPCRDFFDDAESFTRDCE